MGVVTYPDLTAAASTTDVDLSAIWQSGALKKITNDLVAKYVNRNSPTADFIETITSSKDYSAIETDHLIISDSSSGTITLGLFNGASRDGAKVIIQAIGSGNQTDVELVSNGTTDFILYPNQIALLVWDGTNWQYYIKRIKNDTIIDSITADKDYATLDDDHRIISDSSSGDVTIGLFNGANFDGILILLQAIGSGNITNVELATSGVTDFLIEPGESAIIVWDGTNWQYNVLKEPKVEVITSNQTLEVNKKYFAQGNLELNLPSTASVGDTIEITTRDNSKILQTDSEHIIDYLLRYFTTKGVTGYLQLFFGNKIQLIYNGSGNYPVEPGVKLSDPATLPTGYTTGCAFSSDATYLAISHFTSPRITIYKRSGDTFTKLSDPATLPTADANGCVFSNDDTYLVVTLSSSPYITIYKRSGDTFTKLSDPATLPTGPSYKCAFSPDNIYLAIAHSVSPRVTIYKRSGDTFTKLTNPATLPTGDAWGCSFSHSGNILAVAHTASPYVTIYKRENDTFIKIANPSSLPASTGRDCSFSFDGKYLAVAHVSTPYVTIYRIAGDTYLKMTDPNSLATSNGNACCFAFNSKYLFLGELTNSPYMKVYKVIDDIFLAISDPATLPTAGAEDIDISRDGNYACVAHKSTSPYMTIYKQVQAASKKWIVQEFNNLNNESDLVRAFQ